MAKVDFAKRLQSRLAEKKYKVTKDECRTALAAICANPELPTEEEMKRAGIRLITLSQPETQAIIAVQTQETEPEITIPEPEVFEIPIEDLPCLQPPEETKPESSLVPENSSQMTQATQAPVSGISQMEVGQAVNQAIAQLGATGNKEAVNILSSLAQELMAEISDIEEMTSTLITAYLNKRENILASAIGTIESLRSAQSSSFQSGRDESFFGKKDQKKRQFLEQIQAAFN